MAYAAASDVAALVPDLLGGQATFSAATSPTLAQVEAWLSSGCAALEAELRALGYPSPGSGSDLLRQANALYAAMYAELSRLTTTIAPGERTRAQAFRDAYLAELRALRQIDWSAYGVAREVAIHWTGGSRVRIAGGALP